MSPELAAKALYEQSMRYATFGTPWDELSAESRDYWRWKATRPEVLSEVER